MKVVRGTPNWVKNRLPKNLHPNTQTIIKKELMNEYYALTPEERKATEIPT